MSTTKDRAAAAGAKVPTDHAAKAEVTGEQTSVTVQGFDLAFDPDVFDDDDLMTDLERGNPHRALRAITSGPDQIDEIREAVRDEKGTVKRSALLQFVVDALEAAGQGKSSASHDS